MEEWKSGTQLWLYINGHHGSFYSMIPYLCVVTICNVAAKRLLPSSEVEKNMLAIVQGVVNKSFEFGWQYMPFTTGNSFHNRAYCIKWLLCMNKICGYLFLTYLNQRRKPELSALWLREKISPIVPFTLLLKSSATSLLWAFTHCTGKWNPRSDIRTVLEASPIALNAEFLTTHVDIHFHSCCNIHLTASSTILLNLQTIPSSGALADTNIKYKTTNGVLVYEATRPMEHPQRVEGVWKVSETQKMRGPPISLPTLRRKVQSSSPSLRAMSQANSRMRALFG